MVDQQRNSKTSRRRFNGLFKTMSLVGTGSAALLQTGSIKAAVSDAKATLDDTSAWPKMTYRTLGRTGHNSSRLIYGCGAALSRRRADSLLNRALEAGVNTFDVGTGRYYDSAELNLAPFLKSHREKIFLISKSMAYVDLAAADTVTPKLAAKAAANWAKILDESLSQLKVEHVDAYYLMAANNVSLLLSDEFHRAVDQAKAAGKMSYLGLSTHENAEAVLTAAADSRKFDLAMIAITPAGWYDWNNKGMLKDSPPMTALQDVLTHARKAGIGLIGMKAARPLAGRAWLGSGNSKAFDGYYSTKLRAAALSDFQRSYAYVLEHGLDAVNADIQSFDVLRENYAAAATAHDVVA